MVEVFEKKEDYILWHRKMWNWIADNVRDFVIKKQVHSMYDIKAIYLKLHGFGYISNGCFCCQYTCDTYKDIYADQDCSLCPLEWNSTKPEFMCEKNDGANWWKAYELYRDACSLFNENNMVVTEEVDNMISDIVKISRNIANLEERNN